MFISPKRIITTKDGKHPLTDDLIAIFIIGMSYLLIFLHVEVPLIGKIGYMAAVSWVFGMKSLAKFGEYLNK